MAIDKALNQAPLGLSEMVEDMEPAIEKASVLRRAT
jgi:hypothetical protein